MPDFSAGTLYDCLLGGNVAGGVPASGNAGGATGTSDIGDGRATLGVRGGRDSVTT